MEPITQLEEPEIEDAPTDSRLANFKTNFKLALVVSKLMEKS